MTPRATAAQFVGMSQKFGFGSGSLRADSSWTPPPCPTERRHPRAPELARTSRDSFDASGSGSRGRNTARDHRGPSPRNPRELPPDRRRTRNKLSFRATTAAPPGWTSRTRARRLSAIPPGTTGRQARGSPRTTTSQPANPGRRAPHPQTRARGSRRPILGRRRGTRRRAPTRRASTAGPARDAAQLACDGTGLGRVLMYSVDGTVSMVRVSASSNARRRPGVARDPSPARRRRRPGRGGASLSPGPMPRVPSPGRPRAAASGRSREDAASHRRGGDGRDVWTRRDAAGASARDALELDVDPGRLSDDSDDDDEDDARDGALARGEEGIGLDDEGVSSGTTRRERANGRRARARRDVVVDDGRDVASGGGVAVAPAVSKRKNRRSNSSSNSGAFDLHPRTRLRTRVDVDGDVVLADETETEGGRRRVRTTTRRRRIRRRPGSAPGFARATKVPRGVGTPRHARERRRIVRGWMVRRAERRRSTANGGVGERGRQGGRVRVPSADDGADG